MNFLMIILLMTYYKRNGITTTNRNILNIKLYKNKDRYDLFNFDNII